MPPLRVDFDRIPECYPTHVHSSEFWEALGRAVATFGFLEDMLGRAIYAFSALTEHPPEEIEAAWLKWGKQLKRALSEPLGGLITEYERAVKIHGAIPEEELEILVRNMREAKRLRDVLCHGSWQEPDSEGRSVPRFIGKDDEVFQTAVDVQFLKKTQRTTAELSALVVSSVTGLGWQFPGVAGPGRPIGSNTDP